MTFLDETKEILKLHGRIPGDVKWCGAVGYGYFTWQDFAKLSRKDYHRGFGGAEVAGNLIVVGDDFWLERHEYDGSEWWEFKSMPVKPGNYRVPEELIVSERYTRLVLE